MVEVKRDKGKLKRKLVRYDSLTKQEQRQDCSIWKGERGVYVFENTGEIEVKRPICRIYLNRTYFTGLFRSKKRGEYLGDIKEPEGKKYLLFRVKGESEMEILARVVVN
jgi:site-specific DNA-adenine methylase